ncbi:MAG: DNA polymerase III subunit delta' [Anaerolineales bacterium]|nr:DNA polymerase III subunit delta' [Anaerolineales bacterium]
MSWDIIGHEWAARLLQQHLANKQVRHAYLFTGPDSIGKRTLALRFAQALNCETVKASADPCGECRACRLTLQQSFPDLHIVQADETGSVLRVGQIRVLQRQLALTPYEGTWRIAMLLRFHEANDSAANALLKTLEEPAAQVVLLLTARSAESLLPTIVSRCEVIPLRPLSTRALSKALELRGESPDRAQLIAGISAGCPGRALRMVSDPELLEMRNDLIDDFVGLLSSNRAARFVYVERLTRAREPAGRRGKAEEALLTWLSLWRDVLIVITSAQANAHNPDRNVEMERLASRLNRNQVFEALQATMRTLEVIHKYGNVRVALETLMLDLPQIA